SASYAGFKDRASIICYAGTTNERAQETLDVTLAELRRLRDSIEPEEVERVQAGPKAAPLMQEETTPARARPPAAGWGFLGRGRERGPGGGGVSGVRAARAGRRTRAGFHGRAAGREGAGGE